MDFRNWLLFLIVVGVIGFSSYYIYKNSYIEQRIEDSFLSPTPKVSDDFYERPSDWKEYKAETLSFYHPNDWKPGKREPFGGAIIEDIVLNIPEAVDSYISYSAVAYDAIKPDDIASEDSLEINNRTWVKWVREGEGYVSYDYYTKELLGDAGIGSFGVHVTLTKKNEELEKKLTTLITTIELYKEFISGNDDSIELESTTSGDSRE